MNRRQFLGASLSCSIASAALPWDPFVQWLKNWFGEVKRKGVSQLTSFAELMKEKYADTNIESLLYGESPMFAMVQR